MSEKTAEQKTNQPKNHHSSAEKKEQPEISHFGGKPIHPKDSSTKKEPQQESHSEKPKNNTVKPQATNKKKTTQAAKLNDPDFAGKKAVQKTEAKKERHKGKPSSKAVILEKTEVKPVKKSPKTVEKPVDNYVEKSEEPPVVDTPKVKTEPQAKASEKPAKRPSRRHTLPAAVRVLFSFALLVGTSLLFTWYTFLRQFEWDFGRVNTFMTEYAGQYYLTWGIIFCVMATMAALTWKVFLTVGATFSLLSILTFINSQKLAVRDAPFLPDDIRMAGNIGQVASYADQDAIMRLVAGVILVIVAAILLEIFAKKTFGRDMKKLPWWERHAIIPRLTYGIVAMAALTTLTMPLLRQKPVSWVQGMELIGWNQTANYDTNGIIIGFTNNLGRIELNKPDGYNEDTMRTIAERYEAKKAADETKRKPLTEVADRIIVILDETFYDPALLANYYPYDGGEVLPNLHRIFRNTASGYMYSPEYGGNTANIEFEVQTGLSNYWAQTIPYVTAVTKTAGVTSVASIAKSLGYETTAIHSYDGSMYKRNLVYPLLGYDDFIDRNGMKNQDKEPGPDSEMHLNDKAIFQEVLDVLADGSKLQLVNAVTMQNHSPYWLPEYPKLEFRMTSDSKDDWDYSRNTNYQSLHEGDKYIAEFLAELDKSEERTVVLWFGDHVAGLFGKYITSPNKADRDTIHLTPYFIWANFKTDNLFTTKEVREHNTKLGINIPASIRGVDLPTTTPNCLQNTMYNLLKVEKPAFFYLLDEVCSTTPILAHSYLEDNEPDMTQALKDYELVNYDALSGKRYWEYE